jgi:hypothetical protein
MTIPRRRPRDFANASDGQTTATVSFSPAQNHLWFFVNFAIVGQTRPASFSANGDPLILLVALVLDRFRDHF